MRISKPLGHPKKICTKNFHLAIIAEGSHPMLSATFHLDTQDTATIRDVRRAIGSQLQALHNGSAPLCCLFGDLVRGDVRLTNLDMTLLQYGIVGGSTITTAVRGFERGLGHCDGGAEGMGELDMEKFWEADW